MFRSIFSHVSRGLGRRRLQRPTLLAVFAAVLVAVLATSVAAAATAGGPGGRRELALPGGASSPRTASPYGEYSTIANPITLDPPVADPPTTPKVVVIADHAAFGNGPPPAVTTVALPKGNWAQVVLEITGTEQGVQYDRLCEVFDGATQIFLGVTPEPTSAGITWHVQKDITGYASILSGSRTFSTYVDNYLSSADTGIPTITAKLLFYPAGGKWRAEHLATLSSPALAGDALDETGPAAPATDPGVTNDVVPLLPSGASNTLATVGTGQTVTSTVTLPDDVSTATLDLYAVGQSNDEFWWGYENAFREIEVSIDGKPAGVVWPYPYVYTGGVNPLIWAPLTGVHTMDIPSYRLDLTPFAGMLGGTHTISLTVAGNGGYWLAGGSLLLSTGQGKTSGAVTSDSLQFPTKSVVTSSKAIGSNNYLATTDSASASYEISGTVVEAGKTWTDTVSEHMQFGDDQTDVDESCTTHCFQWAHGEETQTATDSLTGPMTENSQSRQTWMIDAPNGYAQNASGSAFFLPASVSQQLSVVATRTIGNSAPIHSSLLEAITGYGALGEGTRTITDGGTSGMVTYDPAGCTAASTPSGCVYQRVVVTRGGRVMQNTVVSG